MSVMIAARDRIANALVGSFYDNPVVTKAFRTRMRGWKAFVIMGAYVLLMAIVMIIAYLITAAMFSARRYGAMIQEQVHMGAVLFGTLTWVQTVLLTLIVPSLSSGALTYEQEKRTLELLVLAPLSAGKIVLGKQLSSFLYALVLLACSVPLAGMCVMFGGISPMEIALTYLLLVGWVFLITCAGVMWSSLSRKTMIASGTNFGLCFLYFLVTWIGPSVLMMSMGYYSHGRPNFTPFLLLNPALGAMGVMQSAAVCGLQVSLALVAVTLHVAVGLIFLLVAMTHVRYKPTDRALPIRLLFLGLTAFAVWLAAGCTQHPATLGAVSEFGIWLLVPAMVLAAAFGSGVVCKPANGTMLGYALSPRRVMKGDIGGAIGFMTLWAAVAYAAYGLASLLQVNALGQAIARGFWQSYAQVGVSILVIVAATTAVGVLASSLAKKRSSAAALVVLFGVAMFAGYAIIALNCPVMHPGEVKPAGAFAAFWPLTPILSATGHWPYDYPAPTKIGSAWIATSVAYAVIGLLALCLASPAFKKTGGVVAEE